MERMFRFKPQEHRIPGTKVQGAKTHTGNVSGATSKANEAALFIQGQSRVTLSRINSLQSSETASLWQDMSRA